jgi:dTDP-4-amino-4,6-dideoxygalactose transaminase
MDQVSELGSHVFHIFALKISNRSQAEAILSEYKISYGFHYPRAIHQNAAYVKSVRTPVPLRNSEKIADETISLPIFPSQTDFEIERVINAVAKIH